MDLLAYINENNENEIDKLIAEKIIEKNKNCEKCECLGFAKNMTVFPIHKGFIGLDTKIKYNNLAMEDYSMKTTDYFYLFVHEVKKHKIKTKGELINFIECFLIQYFGYNKNEYDSRSEIFNDIAWETTDTDDEYFKKLENNQIGDLKDKGIAMCTERAAVAQNLLSLFDIESYYVMGCINNNGNEEAHCYNIARSKTDFKILDYSIPVIVKQSNGFVYFPFQGSISKEEFDSYIKGDIIKDYEGYNWIIENGKKKKVLLDSNRSYIANKMNFKKEVARKL